MESLIPQPRLDDNTWIDICQYLDLPDQLNLASVNDYFEDIFKLPSLSKQFENFDHSSTANKLSDGQLHRLLAKLNRRVISFTGSMIPSDDSEQHVWLLRRYCPNLRKLKLLFKRDLDRTLSGLRNIEELHARLYFGKLSDKNLRSLVELPKLKKLTLEASCYSGKDLCLLVQLQSLEIGSHPGFDANELTDCCMAMQQLQHLNMGCLIRHLSTYHFQIIKNNCDQLKRLAFGIRNLEENVSYELVCQLPKLQHLLVWIDGPVRIRFLTGLLEKLETLHPIESLVFVGSQLPVEQVRHICEINSLRELDVSCDEAPIQDLLKLHNLKYLHITMPAINNSQLMDLVQRLPYLTLLNVRSCRCINEYFVLSVLQLAKEISRSREKIKIYLKGSDINWNQIDPKELKRKNALIEFINGSLDEPVLFREELSFQIPEDHLNV